MVLLEVEFESNINGILEEMADHGNVDTAADQEIQDMWPQERSEGELIDIIEEGDKKNDNVPEEDVLTKKIHFKGTVRYFMTLKAQKIKCL